MHTAVLDATGYTLLLSSFITLVILLWKGCKRKKKSPFYVLSASDIFSATLTAIVLLVNYIEAGIRFSYNWQNSTSSSDMPSHAWPIEDNYRFPFLLAHDLREAINEVDLDVTLTCGMKDILVQYGMLLAALTNALISLLTFTVQCNLNVACVKQRCANVMKALKNTQSEPKDADVKCQENEISENEQESASQRGNINAEIRSSVIRRITKISKFRALKEDDKRSTSFLVTSHWLVPFLVAGILYFAEYSDTSDMRHTEDIECVFGSNFPMSDFDGMFLDTDDNPNVTDSVKHMTLPERYFFNENLSNKSKPSGAEIDEVVSKVQSIVGTALRYTSNSTKGMGPQNLTQYIVPNNIMKYIKNITNINGVVAGLNNTLIERDINVQNSSTDDIDLNQDSQISLFYDASRNASEELDVTTSGSLSSVSRMSTENKDDSYQEDAQTHPASTEESTTQKTTDISLAQNITFVSNGQIYNGIMKRIQAASVHSAEKSRYKDKDQPEISNLRNYTAKRKPNSIKDLFLTRDDNRYVNAGAKQSSLLRMSNECLVSTKFLKLQLFVLSLAIYFLPILLSCILQMRGKYMCKSTLTILRAKANPTSMDERIQRQDSAEGSSVPQGSRKRQNWLQSGSDATEEHRESYRENESIALEIDCLVRILDTIKLSLILCVVLWTPVFLGTLLRVYSCIRAPQWLNDVTFLSAISFGVVRNALNINIIRIQEACSDASMKENRIHPIE